MQAAKNSGGMKVKPSILEKTIGKSKNDVSIR